MIVAGDLNDRRGEPTLRRIRGLDDIWSDLIQTGLTKYSEDEAERWTYIFQGRRQQIDHILLSQSIKGAAKRTRGIRGTAVAHNNPLASDHRPLVVTLDFP